MLKPSHLLLFVVIVCQKINFCTIHLLQATKSPAIADKPTQRESMPKIAQI